MSGGRVEKTAKGWRVSYYEGKRRKYKSFATKAKATAFAGNAKVIDEDINVTMEERILIGKLRKAAVAVDMGLPEMVDSFIAQMGDVLESIDAKEALTLFTTDCRVRGLRARTIANYEMFVGLLLRALEPASVGELTPESVQAWIVRTYQSESSRRTARAYVQGWLRFCEGRGWCRGWKEPMTWRTLLDDSRQIVILKPDVMGRFIGAMPEPLHASVALMAFAGMRPEEVIPNHRDAIEWDAVDFKSKVVRMPGSVVKTRTGRHLTGLPDNLWTWLDQVPRGKRKGAVCPVHYSGFAKSRKAARIAAGLDRWPNDVLRHSFASYAFHELGAEHTIELMGHTKPDMLFRHYKGAGSRTSANDWFKIRPVRT